MSPHVRVASHISAAQASLVAPRTFPRSRILLFNDHADTKLCAGNILDSHPLPNSTAPNTANNLTISPSKVPMNRNSRRATLCSGTIAGIVVAVVAILLVLNLCLFLLRRRSRRNHRSRPKISAPMAQASELHASIVLQELSNGRIVSHELSGMEKVLPPRPLDEKVAELHNMEARSGNHPAQRDRKERIAAHKYM